MRNRTGYPFLGIILIFIAILPLYSQDLTTHHQGYIIWEDIVYPSGAEAYEKMVREQIGLFDSAGFPARVNVYQTTDYIYYWVFEIDHYADIDTLYQEFNRIYAQEPEKMEAITQGYTGTHESTRSWTFYSDPDLSFKSGGLHQPDREKPYLHMGFCYPEKGKMQQAREAMQGFAQLAGDKKATLGWDTYIGDLGVDGPMLFWTSFTKDPQEFFRLNAADFDLMGTGADTLWKELQGVMRKYDEKTGWYREDLSYNPR